LVEFNCSFGFLLSPHGEIYLIVPSHYLDLGFEVFLLNISDFYGNSVFGVVFYFLSKGIAFDGVFIYQLRS
jgi:hypothetical protein